MGVVGSGKAIERLRLSWREDRQRFEHSLLSRFHSDLRLLLSLLIVWAVTYCGFLAGWSNRFLGLSWLVLALLALSSYAARCWGIFPQLALALLLVVLVTALQLALIQLRAIPASSHLFGQLEGKQISLVAEVKTSKKIAEQEYLLEVASQGVTYRQSSYEVAGSVSVFWRGLALEAGDQVEFLGKVSHEGPRLILKQAVLRTHTSQPSQSASERKDLVAHRLTEHVTAEQAALILGLAYGDDSGLDSSSRDDFKLAGLSHLTAVSGSNITLIFILCYRAASYLRCPRRWAIFMGLLGTYLYASFVGWEGSVIRAWTMGLLGALALVLGRGQHVSASYFSALLLLLLFLPELCFNLGFQLSAVATASLIFLARSLARLLGFLLPSTCADLCAVACSASLWCSPLLLCINQRIGLYSVAANLCAVPLVPLLTVLGLIIFMLTLLGLTTLALPLIYCAQFLAEALLGLASFFAHLPGAVLQVDPGPYPIICALFLLLLISALILILDLKLTTAAEKSPFTREIAV